MSELTEFDYLINRFEGAAQSSEPARHGYYEHRRALYDHVRGLEARAAAADRSRAVPTTAVAKVREHGDFSATIDWLLNPLPEGALLYEAPQPAIQAAPYPQEPL